MNFQLAWLMALLSTLALFNTVTSKTSRRNKHHDLSRLNRNEGSFAQSDFVRRLNARANNNQLEHVAAPQQYQQHQHQHQQQHRSKRPSQAASQISMLSMKSPALAHTYYLTQHAKNTQRMQQQQHILEQQQLMLEQQQLQIQHQQQQAAAASSLNQQRAAFSSPSSDKQFRNLKLKKKPVPALEQKVAIAQAKSHKERQRGQESTANLAASGKAASSAPVAPAANVAAAAAAAASVTLGSGSPRKSHLVRLNAQREQLKIFMANRQQSRARFLEQIARGETSQLQQQQQQQLHQQQLYQQQKQQQLTLNPVPAVAVANDAIEEVNQQQQQQQQHHSVSAPTSGQRVNKSPFVDMEELESDGRGSRKRFKARKMAQQQQQQRQAAAAATASNATGDAAPTLSQRTSAGTGKRLSGKRTKVVVEEEESSTKSADDEQFSTTTTTITTTTASTTTTPTTSTSTTTTTTTTNTEAPSSSTISNSRESNRDVNEGRKKSSMKILAYKKRPEEAATSTVTEEDEEEDDPTSIDNLTGAVEERGLRNFARRARPRAHPLNEYRRIVAKERQLQSAALLAKH